MDEIIKLVVQAAGGSSPVLVALMFVMRDIRAVKEQNDKHSTQIANLQQQLTACSTQIDQLKSHQV